MTRPASLSGLGAFADMELTGPVKGFPLDERFGTVRDLRAARPMIFNSGFSTPFAVLHEGAIRRNAQKMARYCADRDVLLAPHAKTTMAPQLFSEQLARGAWGLTVATMWQASLCRRFGVPKLLLANELVEPNAVEWAVSALADPDFALLSYVDSPGQVERTAAVVNGMQAHRPLDVLLEIGYRGGRTGCRTTADISQVTEALARSPWHRLAGVAGFEGFLGRDARPQTLARVRSYLRTVRQAAEHVARRGAIDGDDPVILTAGGSAYFDLVTEELAGPLPDGREVQVILRCGGYIAHEAGPYSKVSPFSRLAALSGYGGPLEQAAEVWASVLARPEPALAILDAGKRDVPVDTGMPELLRVRRGQVMETAPPGWRVESANDQHLYLAIAEADALAPGDLVSLGISHPCTFFDKWTWIPMVDTEYRVTDAIRTYF